MTSPTEQTKQPSSPPGRGCDWGPETGVDGVGVQDMSRGHRPHRGSEELVGGGQHGSDRLQEGHGFPSREPGFGSGVGISCYSCNALGSARHRGPWAGVTEGPLGSQAGEVEAGRPRSLGPPFPSPRGRGVSSRV